MANSVERALSGWGSYCHEKCHVFRPESAAAIGQILVRGGYGTYIPRGLGRSYGDASVNGDAGVIDQTRLSRFLAFDENTGILECEAGVTLGEIIDVFLPRGWFLPTTPGTKFVTVGGAIAADVHGKNHHLVGSFGNFVRRLQLVTASGEVLTCSTTKNDDAFWGTVGGMGLTGVILTAHIQLVRVNTAYCRVKYNRTADLDEALEVIAATDKDYRYSVAWVDCLASGNSMGRSIVMLGNDAEVQELPLDIRDTPLCIPHRRSQCVPFYCPEVVVNRFSGRAFNSLYYGRQNDAERIIDFDSFFYPLDSVRHWNRLYGKRGFIQYQAHFPHKASRAGLVELLGLITNSRQTPILAVLKSSGSANPGLLSYLRPGHTLAVDLANTGEGLRRLVQNMDEVLLKHCGRLYLAKDATTSADAFHCMYDRVHEFSVVKARLDPDNRLVSSQARRLGLVASQ